MIQSVDPIVRVKKVVIAPRIFGHLTDIGTGPIGKTAVRVDPSGIRCV
jgi:hypothetical protein